jgi:radical SAM-linked protein
MADTSNQSRLRVRYRKDGRLAYLGHLEVLGTINRSIRRSGVPFAVGNGFARRIRLQFSQALPVGASSVGEYYDLMVTERLDPAQALRMLRDATPRGLAPDAAAYVSRRLPALEAWVNRADWDVTVRGLRAADALDAALEGLREKGELHYMRGEKPKSIDLGRALVSWDVTPCEDGLRVLLATRSSNDGALRPQVLLDAAFSTERLAGAVAEAGRPTLSVCRVGQWHEGEDGNLVEPLPSDGEGA